MLAAMSLSSPAAAHTTGVWQANYGFGWPQFFAGYGTYADDNYTDGHCDYAKVVAPGGLVSNGRWSCGSFTSTDHRVSWSNAVARGCITGHFKCPKSISWGSYQ